MLPAASSISPEDASPNDQGNHAASAKSPHFPARSQWNGSACSFRSGQTGGEGEGNVIGEQRDIAQGATGRVHSGVGPVRRAI